MSQFPFEGPSSQARGSKRGGTRRAPPPLDRASLERSALAYLERYASSSANLRRVLLRKARRSCEHHGGDHGEAEALVDDVVTALGQRGLVDDRAFARGLWRRLRRRGSSARRIRASLIERGVCEELADEVLGAEAREDDDLVAACRYARRRRIGPYRAGDGERGERRERDLAALAQAGFSLEVALRVVDAAVTAQDLDEIVANEGRDA
jgi:regulatory protein